MHTENLTLLTPELLDCGIAPWPPEDEPDGIARLTVDGGRDAEDALEPVHQADDPDEGDTARPVIAITTEEHDVIGQAITALAKDPDVYQRGNVLVSVMRDASPLQGVIRPAGLPRISRIQTPTVRERLTRRAYWVKPKRQRDGSMGTALAHPPTWAIQGVVARGEYPKIRPLEAGVECPILRPDGGILDEPGYDASAAILYTPNGEFSAIPDRPTRDDARRAAGDLLDLVGDFPFATDPGRAVWLAALLTPLARFAITGGCPLFLFNANTPGSGKSLLCDLIAVITTGRPMARTIFPDSDDEMRKRITSVALAGDRLMLIDNVSAPFGGQSIEAALTGTTWTDRKLGKSEMTPELPLFACWYATGNNVEIRGDTIRRVILCRLESKEELPEERSGFRYPCLLEFAKVERGRLVAAALTILRAYAVAGRPDTLPRIGSFEAWSDVVRSAVAWTLGIDPCATRNEIRACDTESISRVRLVTGWAELPGARKGLSVSDALAILRAEPERYNALRAAVMEWSPDDDLPKPQIVGNRLKAIRGRTCNGMALDCFAYQGTQRWRVA